MPSKLIDETIERPNRAIQRAQEGARSGAVDVFHCGGEAIDGEDSVPPLFSTFDITRVNADYGNGLLEACTV